MPDILSFAKNLWLVDGPNVRDFGITFPTRMVIAKLADNALWVSSPVSVSFNTLKCIAELGFVKYLLAGTPRHVWRLEAWHILFPEAELWVPRPTAMTLKKGHLPLTGILGNEPPESWRSNFDQLAFQGNPLIEEIVFFHKESRTLILDDLIQIHPIIQGHPIRNALVKLGGLAPPYGGVPIDGKLSFINRDLARQSLEKLLSWDFDKLIIAHGPCVEKDAKPFVERAFRWLARPSKSHRNHE
jgi:hypothetical protein